MGACRTLVVLIVCCAGFVVGHSLNAEVVKTLGNVLNPENLLRSLSSQRSSQSEPSDCDVDIQRLLDALSTKELWALRVFDSSSYFITGILYGNSAGLGNYDECLRARPPGEADRYWPLYSLVEIMIEQEKNTSSSSKSDVRTTYNKAVLSAIHSPSATVGLILDNENECDSEGFCDRTQGKQWTTLLDLNLGICWPRSCGSEAPRKAVAGLLNHANGVLEGSGYRLRVLPTREGASDVGLPRRLSLADWIVMTVFIILVVFAVVGTCLDVSLIRSPGKRPAAWQTPFLVFSVYTNGRRLINVSAPTPDSLTAVSGIKVFSILWVILGHRYLYIRDLPYTNKIVLLDIVKDWHKQLLIASPLTVDTFFTIGGILNAYNFFLGVRKGNPVGIIKFFVHRYIRLTPALAVMAAFTATWIYHLNDGPIWHKLASTERTNCQNNWWPTLLYVANYVNPNTQCMLHTWYLMTDMQLHWLSALILFPMARWRKAGTIWLMLLIPISCAIPFYVSYSMNFRTAGPIDTTAGRSYDQMQYLYLPAHTRATPYLVGLLIGYELYRSRYVVSGFSLSWKAVAGGWTLSTVLALTTIFAAYPFYQLENEISIWWSAIYVGFHRLAWSISIGWIVFACGTGYGGPVNVFLSCAPFVVLGRLVYGMYLTQGAVQLADAGALRTSDYYSDFRIVQRSLSDFVIAAVFGLVLSLALESPVSAAEKIVFGGPPKKKRKNSTEVQPQVTPQHNPAQETPQYIPPNVTPQHNPAQETPQYIPLNVTQRKQAQETPQYIPPNVTPQHNPAQETPQYIPPNVTHYPAPGGGIENLGLAVVLSENFAMGAP